MLEIRSTLLIKAARKGSGHPTSHACRWLRISVLSNRHSPTYESIRDYLFDDVVMQMHRYWKTESLISLERLHIHCNSITFLFWAIPDHSRYPVANLYQRILSVSAHEKSYHADTSAITDTLGTKQYKINWLAPTIWAFGTIDEIHGITLWFRCLHLNV